MLPKLLKKAQRPPPDFSDGKWTLVRSFHIMRTIGMCDTGANIKFFKLALHDCIETPLKDNHGEDTLAMVNVYRFSKQMTVVACSFKFFNQAEPSVVLVGFEGKHDDPSAYIRFGDRWYYKDHIRGVEIFPCEQFWEKDYIFENAVLRITGIYGEEGIYLKVKKELPQEQVLALA